MKFTLRRHFVTGTALRLCAAYLAIALGLPANGEVSLKVGSSIQAPHAIVSGKEGASGFFVDVLREAGRRAGYSVKWEFRKESLDRTLDDGLADIYAGGFSNPERKKKFYISAPWWPEQHYFVVQEDSPIRNSADLAGRTLLFEDRPAFPVPLNKLFPNVRTQAMNSRPERLEAVCRGEADAGLFHGTAIRQLAKSRPPGCNKASLRIIAQNEVEVGFSIIAKMERKAEVDALRHAIETMSLDGTMAGLARQNGMTPIQGDELKQEKDWSTAAVIGALIVFGVLLGTAYFVYRLRESHRQNLQKIEDGSKAKEVFLATMSHEIRTPMNAVLGYLDLLQDSPLRPDQQSFVNDIRMSTRILLQILSDILEYSKLRSNSLELNRDKCNLVEVVDHAARHGALAADSKHLEFIARIDTRIPLHVVTDGIRVQRIIENLVSNAVKFTVSGYVRLDVEYQTPGQVVITVADSGAGISEEEIPKIFEPFQQVNSSGTRKSGGVGLGLSIVQQIVKAMGGSIEVESRPGFGTRFKVVLGVGVLPEQSPWIDEYGSGGQVALVAAESANLEVLREYLSKAGRRVVHYRGLEDAEALLSVRDPEQRDVQHVYVEANLFQECPDFVSRLREAPGGGRVQFVLVGAITSTRLLSQAARDEFHAILTWPVSPGELAAAMKVPVIKAGSNAVTRSGFSVLVVDDNSLNRRVASALLSKLGCNVEIAEDGLIALDMCRKKEFQLVLMDCQMPNMDGFESAQRIRTISSKWTRPSIFGTSANTEPETPKKCKDSGMDGYLPKPYSLKDFEVLVKDVGEKTRAF